MPSTNNHSASLSNEAWIADCQQIADGIRRRVLSHTVTHGGYLSQACSGGSRSVRVSLCQRDELGPQRGAASGACEEIRVPYTHI